MFTQTDKGKWFRCCNVRFIFQLFTTDNLLALSDNMGNNTLNVLS